MLADIIPKIAGEEQGPPQPYYPRPSAAGPERCIRQMVYHGMNTPPAPWPNRALLVFDDSSWHEELVKDWIRKSAFTLHSEQMAVDCPMPGPVTSAIRKCLTCKANIGKDSVREEVLHGHIDGILTDMTDKDRLLECKAINHFSFDRAWKGDPWPLDYFAQVCVYIRGLQEDNPDLREAILLIKNKNTAAFMEFILDYDRKTDTMKILEVTRSDGSRAKPEFVMEHVIVKVYNKFASIDAHIVAKSLPARPYPPGTDWPCGYCRWGVVCWDGYEKEFVQMAKEQAMDEELENTCAYYLQADRDAKEMDKEAKRLKQIIGTYMKEKSYMSGRVGPYVVTRSLRHSTSWDEEAIPLDVVAVAKQ
ncbi:hypothetical protein LCGC14_2166610, partial [marine sediment metagenome]